MLDAAVILFGAMFVNNFVMVQFLGLCPFMGASQRLDSAIGMGAATTFVLTLSAGLTYLADAYLLTPLDLGYLRIVTFIVVIASVVQFAALVMRATQPLLHEALGIYVPLITTNCAVLGVALQGLRMEHNFAASLLYGFGAAAGFALLLLMFAAIRERLPEQLVPLPFRGAAINMITAGLLSLGFLGFTGMD
ncbi:MAG: electron transport complex subunit RsxA [Pseudomonadales bacterium]